MRIVGILLAAGRGSRFGGPKLLAPLADGTPLGVAAARNLCAAVPEVVAVVHPADRELAQALTVAGARVVVCAEAEAGMGVSLAAGVGAAADADSWVIALADMPYIGVDSIDLLVRALADGAALVAPCYRGQRGHPVGFSAEFGPALRALQGDRGARELLARHADRLQCLEVDDPGILRDVDTPADLVMTTR